MLGCTALLALFLGFGKRRHELAGDNAGKQRQALRAYTPVSLNIALGVTGAATAMTYVAAYTLDPDDAGRPLPLRKLPLAHRPFHGVRAPPLPLYSSRGAQGARAGRRSRRRRKILRDVPFVLNAVLWVIGVIFAIVYRLRPSYVVTRHEQSRWQRSTRHTGRVGFDLGPDVVDLRAVPRESCWLASAAPYGTRLIRSPGRCCSAILRREPRVYLLITASIAQVVPFRGGVRNHRRAWCRRFARGEFVARIASRVCSRAVLRRASARRTSSGVSSPR